MRKIIQEPGVFFKLLEEKNMLRWIYTKKKHKVSCEFLSRIQTYHRDENFTTTEGNSVNFCAPSEIQKRMFSHLSTRGIFEIYRFEDKYWLLYLFDHHDIYNTKKYGLNCVCWCHWFWFKLRNEDCTAPNFLTRNLRIFDMEMGH